MIIHPPLIRLNQGDPITSEGVDNILSAIRALYEALNRPSPNLAITVRNQADGAPLPGAHVSVIPKGKGKGLARTGLYAGSDVKSYIVHQILPGVYSLVVEAAGFNRETRQINIDETGGLQTVHIEMTAKDVDLLNMPDLFGMPVIHAIDAVKRKGFQIARIIDSHGGEFSTATLSESLQKGALVLNQEPAAGALSPRHSPVQLHISAKAEADDLVRVPNLQGFTIEEAEAKLDASRLLLGHTLPLSLVMGMIYMANTNTKETHSTVHPCIWAARVSPEHRFFCETKPDGFRWCDYCFPGKADG